MRYRGMASCLFILLAANSLFAYNFRMADYYYSKRGGDTKGKKSIEKAFRLYEKAMDKADLSNSEKIHAMEKIGRLSYLKGELLTDESVSGHQKRKKIFQNCLRYTRKVSPNKIGKSAAYYYYKALCTAMWGKSRKEDGFLAKLEVKAKIPGIFSAVDKGSDLNSDYEGGGFDRVAAGLYIRSANIPFFGIYDKAKASDAIDRALQARDAGDFYNGYQLKAEVLVAYGEETQAKDLLSEKISELKKRLDRREKLKGGRPENKLYMEIMKRYRDKL